MNKQTRRWKILPVLLLGWMCAHAPAQARLTASLAINAAKTENVISPILYGQFAEFMFEDINAIAVLTKRLTRWDYRDTGNAILTTAMTMMLCVLPGTPMCTVR